VIPALGKVRQEDRKFESSLGYIARTCVRKQHKTRLEVCSKAPAWKGQSPEFKL
jgi:hypothetical protein